MDAELSAIGWILSSLCDHQPTIIEAGCYDGHITKHLVSRCPNGFKNYIAFECDPRSITKIEKNGLPSGVKLIKKAVSNKVGEHSFYISSGKSSSGEIFDASSSLRKPKQVFEDWTEIRFEETINVQCTTIDRECEKRAIDSVDLIWADIQGAERDMMEGAKKTMRNTKFVFLEHSENREWYEGQWVIGNMIKFFKDRNWEVYQKFQYDIIFYNKNLIQL